MPGWILSESTALLTLCLSPNFELAITAPFAFPPVARAGLYLCAWTAGVNNQPETKTGSVAMLTGGVHAKTRSRSNGLDGYDGPDTPHTMGVGDQHEHSMDTSRPLALALEWTR